MIACNLDELLFNVIDYTEVNDTRYVKSHGVLPYFGPGTKFEFRKWRKGKVQI